MVSTTSSYSDHEGGDEKDDDYEHNSSRFPYCASKHMALNFWWRAENWAEAENYEKVATEKLFEQIFTVLESI